MVGNVTFSGCERAFGPVQFMQGLDLVIIPLEGTLRGNYQAPKVPIFIIIIMMMIIIIVFIIIVIVIVITTIIIIPTKEC